MVQLSAVAAFVLIAGAAIVPLTAKAEGFDVRPITIETRDAPGQFFVTNPGNRRIYLETQVFDWSQDASGHDVLTESETAIVSPPAMWVGPHSTYNLRISLPAAASGQERAFRVMIKQLPERGDIVAGRITFALTQNLPAFSEPADVTAPVLGGRFTDSRHILISNTGGRRARLTNLIQDGRVVAPGLVGYALQHSTVAIALPTAVHQGVIEVDTDLGRRTVDLR